MGVVSVSGDTQRVLVIRGNNIDEVGMRREAQYMIVAFYIDEGYNEWNRLF